MTQIKIITKGDKLNNNINYNNTNSKHFFISTLAQQPQGHLQKPRTITKIYKCKQQTETHTTINTKLHFKNNRINNIIIIKKK